MHKLALAMLALMLVACATIHHPADDPSRDECSRYEDGRVTPNCPGDRL